MHADIPADLVGDRGVTLTIRAKTNKNAS